MMKTIHKNSVALAITLLAFSCAGTKARENVLLPALRAAWVGVQEDALRNPDQSESAAIAQMSAALQNGDAVAVAVVNVQLIVTAAMRGIDLRISQGEISPGVAISLKERVSNFSEAIETYVRQR